MALGVLAPSARSQEPDTLGLPYISRVQIGEPVCDSCPPRVCPNVPIVVTVSGELPDGCVAFRGLRELPVGAPFTVLAAEFMVDSCARGCPDVVTPFSASIALPPSAPGAGMFVLISNVYSCPDTSVVARTGAHEFRYEVLADCGEPPPPPPPPLDSLVRSFVSFRVLPERRCDGDSVFLQLVENGCPPCVNLESLVNDTGWVATVQWTPQCLEFRCASDTLTVPLGQLAAGYYTIFTEVIVRVLGTPTPDSTITFHDVVNFEVSRTCDSTQACVFPVLVVPQPITTEVSLCDAQFQPGGTGSLVLWSLSQVELGGLQGRLLCPEPFRVVGLTSPSNSGIHVVWEAEGRGARYVLFTTDGPPIPTGTRPVLVVEMECDSGAVAGTRVYLHTPLEVASGPAGEAVPLCDMSTIRLAGISLCVAGQQQACDVNFDGHADVRDLVLMTTCLRIDPPGSSPLCQDCNADGSWAFGDLLCCAHHILQLPLVPRDSVNADDIRVSFDPVGSDDQGLLVRVRVTGVGDLGAVLLRLRYPGDRWQASIPFSVDLTSAASDGWLPIIDPGQPGVVQLGGLRLTETASADLEFVLRFTPTGVSQAGDQVVVEGADLAGSDGTAFTLATLPSMTLSTPGPGPLPSRVELGAARPNPFARSTVFTVSLPREADVDLAVHDLAGRRIVTLLSGRVAAGQREVAWQADAARNGVYFVRLVVDGKVYTQRVALLRDRR